ncbi:MAG: YqgE/AlgH family protein [Sedimenticola sp.]
MNNIDLTNHLLIAMPGLKDINFRHTVTYICEHDKQGAMGIIINRPSGLRLGDILDQLDISADNAQHRDQIIYTGGPVQSERGFVLHTGDSEWDSTLSVSATTSITTSRDILEATAQGKGPEKCLIALGYAGWAGGQLEEELISNSWLSGPVEERIIFDLPNEERWQAAALTLGIDINLLPNDAGHA